MDQNPTRAPDIGGVPESRANHQRRQYPGLRDNCSDWLWRMIRVLASRRTLLSALVSPEAKLPNVKQRAF